MAINRTVAVGFAADPRHGLAILEALADDTRLARYQPLYAAALERRRRDLDARTVG